MIDRRKLKKSQCLSIVYQVMRDASLPDRGKCSSLQVQKFSKVRALDFYIFSINVTKEQTFENLCLGRALPPNVRMCVRARLWRIDRGLFFVWTKIQCIM